MSTVALVMPHDMILYKPASRYRLKVTADLLVKGYIEDQSASHYNIVERKFSGGQNETFLEINRNNLEANCLAISFICISGVA